MRTLRASGTLRSGAITRRKAGTHRSQAIHASGTSQTLFVSRVNRKSNTTLTSVTGVEVGAGQAATDSR